MLLQLVFALSYLNTASLLIPIGMGIHRRNTMTPPLWMTWGALVVYLLLFLVSLTLAHSDSKPNTLVINYLISGLYGSFVAVGCWLAVPNGWRKHLIAGLGVLGAAGIVTEAFIQGQYNKVSQWSVPLQTVQTTLIALILLNVLLKSTRISLLQTPLFWVAAALLISSVLGTFYDALRDAMLASSRELLMLWLCFQLSVTILCNLLYAVAYHRTRSTTQPA